LRKNYAGIGFTYDSTRDAFIPPKQHASWILDEGTCLWNPPTPMPTDDKMYDWDEETTSWIEFVVPVVESVVESITEVESQSNTEVVTEATE
jgi:hypothetical protein